ncbi:polyisoprenoid-binding protein, partial [Candidatus Parcubacteria bacterium]
LTWNVPLEAGGWLVGDEIKLHIELQAVEQQEEG